MGPHEGAAGDSGWNIKPEEIQGEACGEDSDHAASWRACGAGVGGRGVRLCLEVMEAETQSQRPTGASQRHDKIGHHRTPSSLVSTSEPT